MDNEKGKGKGGGKAPRTPSPKRHGSTMHGEKESAQMQIQTRRTSKPQSIRSSAQRQTTGKGASQAHSRSSSNCEKVHIAMPAITVKRAATSEAKKSDKHAEESEAEAETVYHDRDAEDAMSESSQWSGETEMPEKYVWFSGDS